jgi:hypothetical protein
MQASSLDDEKLIEIAANQERLFSADAVAMARVELISRGFSEVSESWTRDKNAELIKSLRAEVEDLKRRIPATRLTHSSFWVRFWAVNGFVALFGAFYLVVWILLYLSFQWFRSN